MTTFLPLIDSTNVHDIDTIEVILEMLCYDDYGEST